MLQARAGGSEPNDLSSSPIESLSAGVRALSTEQTLAVEAENERYILTNGLARISTSAPVKSVLLAGTVSAVVFTSPH